jgi:hypothetical protein
MRRDISAAVAAGTSAPTTRISALKNLDLMLFGEYYSILGYATAIY